MVYWYIFKNLIFKKKYSNILKYIVRLIKEIRKYDLKCNGHFQLHSNGFESQKFQKYDKYGSIFFSHHERDQYNISSFSFAYLWVYWKLITFLVSERLGRKQQWEWKDERIQEQNSTLKKKLICDNIDYKCIAKKIKKITIIELPIIGKIHNNKNNNKHPMDSDLEGID